MFAAPASSNKARRSAPRNTRRILATAFAVLTLPVLAQVTRSQASEEAVRRLLAAMDAGNRKPTRAIFTADAGSAYGETAPLKTGPALDAWLASDIFGLKARFEIESLSVENGLVAVRGRWGDPPTRPFRYVFEMDGERIRSWRVLRP